MRSSTVFQSFFSAGFECASHRPRHGRRLDLTKATRHETFALADYRRSRRHGFTTVRDGLRWHLVEPRPGEFEFNSVLPMIRAARIAGVEVIWDLCHFGWPEDLDIQSAAFIDRLARLADAFARLLRDETDLTTFITPINEPSYLAWAAGEAGLMHPFRHRQGAVLKRHLALAYIASVEAIRAVQPAARIVATEPLIHVHPAVDKAHLAPQVRAINESQFEFNDLLNDAASDGRYLDIVGACYYKTNQWYQRGDVLENVALSNEDPARIPLSILLASLWTRYRRPLFLAETSAEQDDRALWALMICKQVDLARRAGVPVQGICWYPAIDNLGWDDDRPCRHGIWTSGDGAGRRSTHLPLVNALAQGRRLIETRAPQRHLAPKCDVPADSVQAFEAPP